MINCNTLPTLQVFDVVRASVPLLFIDDVFEQQGAIVRHMCLTLLQKESPEAAGEVLTALLGCDIVLIIDAIEEAAGGLERLKQMPAPLFSDPQLLESEWKVIVMLRSTEAEEHG